MGNNSRRNLLDWLTRFGASRFCSFCVIATVAAFSYVLYTIKDIKDEQAVCACVFVWPVLLILVVAAKLVTTRKGSVRTLLYRATGLRVFAARDYKQRLDILTANYIHELNDGSLLSLFFLLIVSASAIWMRDTQI